MDWIPRLLLLAAAGCGAAIVGVTEHTPAPATPARQLRAAADQLEAAAMPGDANIAMQDRAIDARLRTTRSSLQAVAAVTRELDARRADRRWLCALPDAERDALTNELHRLDHAASQSLSALRSLVGSRTATLEGANARLGWSGWRGSRENELNRLAALAHDVELARAMRKATLWQLRATIRLLVPAAADCRW